MNERMDEIKRDKYSGYCESLVQHLNLLQFDFLRFKVCFEPISCNETVYNIVTLIPYHQARQEDEKVQAFAFLSQYFSPDVSHLKFIESDKRNSADDSFHNSPNDNPDDLDSYLCLIVSGRIVFKQFWIEKEDIDRGYVEGATVLEELICDVHTNSQFYPIHYDDDTLRILGVPGIRLEILALDGEGSNDSFIVAFAKYHLSPLSRERVIGTLNYIKTEYLKLFSMNQKCLHHTIECDYESSKSFHEQEWYFHLQCIFQLYSNFFVSAEEQRVRDYILNYCKSHIQDLKPAHLTDAIANTAGTLYAGAVLRSVYNWLVENGHIIKQGVDDDESVNHFLFITSGIKGELVSEEMKKQRIKWVGKDAIVFVTFINELYGCSYIKWSKVTEQFDADFGEPINGVFARKVTRNSYYIQRSNPKAKNRYPAIQELYSLFHPEN